MANSDQPTPSASNCHSYFMHRQVRWQRRPSIGLDLGKPQDLLRSKSCAFVAAPAHTARARLKHL